MCNVLLSKFSNFRYACLAVKDNGYIAQTQLSIGAQ